MTKFLLTVTDTANLRLQNLHQPANLWISENCLEPTCGHMLSADKSSVTAGRCLDKIAWCTAAARTRRKKSNMTKCVISLKVTAYNWQVWAPIWIMLHASSFFSVFILVNLWPTHPSCTNPPSLSFAFRHQLRLKCALFQCFLFPVIMMFFVLFFFPWRKRARRRIKEVVNQKRIKRQTKSKY